MCKRLVIELFDSIDPNFFDPGESIYDGDGDFIGWITGESICDNDEIRQKGKDDA